MATVSGNFATTGVSAALPATTSLTVALTGLVNRCAMTVEQSPDGGTTWAALFAFDRVLAPYRPPFAADQDEATGALPETYTLKVSAGQYRLRCTAFDAGWCSYTLTAT